MKLRILNQSNDGHWLSVHKADCRDLNRDQSVQWENRHGHRWIENHDSLRSAAESIACDFISEGSMTVEEALGAIYFYPCVDLPETV